MIIILILKELQFSSTKNFSNKFYSRLIWIFTPKYGLHVAWFCSNIWIFAPKTWYEWILNMVILAKVYFTLKNKHRSLRSQCSTIKHFLATFKLRGSRSRSLQFGIKVGEGIVFVFLFGRWGIWGTMLKLLLPKVSAKSRKSLREIVKGESSNLNLFSST